MGRIGITDSSIYANIANDIREALNSDEQYAPSQLAGKIAEVYQKGYDEGSNSGGGSGGNYDEGFEAGKQSVYSVVEGINEQFENIISGTDTGGKSYYDAFWDAYQKNGKQTSYKSAFAGTCWTTELFKPKYDIIPNGTQTSYMMFYQSNIEGDLVELLKASGVTLDTSKVNGWVSYDFSNSKFTRLGKIDYSRANTLASAFSASKNLHTIDELIVGASTSFNGAFNECPALENLKISGTIGQNGLNFKDSPKLSKASITSVMNALSTTTSGLAVTFSQTAVETAFGSTDSAEWTDLKDTRPDWIIVLAPAQGGS